MQVAKRPKLRAKDVAHRQSLTSNEVPIITPATRFWNLDHSFSAHDVLGTPSSMRAPPQTYQTLPVHGGGLAEPSPAEQFGGMGRQLSSGITPQPGTMDLGGHSLILMFGARGVQLPTSAGTTVRELGLQAAIIAEVGNEMLHLV